MRRRGGGDEVRRMGGGREIERWRGGEVEKGRGREKESRRR